MFSEDQKKFIVLEYGSKGSPAAVRRKFLLKYGITARKATHYQMHHFTRVLEAFKRNGIANTLRTGRPKLHPTAQALIQQEMDQHPQTSIRREARKLDFSYYTTQKTMKHDLKLKPYKLHRCQELTENHKFQRLNFCHWISQTNMDPQKIIFSDEKWFHLRPHHNRQNTRVWSTTNPFLYDDSIKQGSEKVMCWAGVVDGRVLPIVWFSAGESVDSKKYLGLLKNKLWPAVSETATIRNYYYQQDGAPPHCSNECLAFLAEKFPERVISRRTEHAWPAHSPDLSPLDYWFWGEMDAVVTHNKPEDLQSLKKLINRTAKRISEERVRRAVANFSRRVEKCADRMGGHFEAEL